MRDSRYKRRQWLSLFVGGVVFNFFLLLPLLADSDTAAVTGRWQTVDDETGKPKSIVEIYRHNGKLYGKIVELLDRSDASDPSDPDPVCTRCPDDRKGQEIVGLEILRGLEPEKNGGDSQVWAKGSILDPAKGKVYDAKLWRDGEQLKVRGYLGIFFRTQTWLPAD